MSQYRKTKRKYNNNNNTIKQTNKCNKNTTNQTLTNISNNDIIQQSTLLNNDVLTIINEYHKFYVYELFNFIDNPDTRERGIYDTMEKAVFKILTILYTDGNHRHPNPKQKDMYNNYNKLTKQWNFNKGECKFDDDEQLSVNFIIHRYELNTEKDLRETRVFFINHIGQLVETGSNGFKLKRVDFNYEPLIEFYKQISNIILDDQIDGHETKNKDYCTFEDGLVTDY